MPGRILIVDTVATNRIVLKVKMLAAHFSVDTCANRTEAEAAIATHRPDLILINLADAAGDLHGFCRSLRASPETAEIALIAVGVADTSKARFAALDAGVDDALPRPMNDAFLMARIRSLLRVRSTTHELMLRDSTSRALGFEDATSDFDGPAQVALLTPAPEDQTDLLGQISKVLRYPVRLIDTGHGLEQAAIHPTPDLFVIDATQDMAGKTPLFGLVSDLRSWGETRLAAQIVIVPDDMPEAAAMFLDLGADDVVPAGCSAAEIALRAARLIRRKLQQDRLRDTVRNGLHAAVTDPLTGLYNRRYVEPHLARLAEQSRLSGQALAVMMIDIDHFKAINDTHGHAAGDKVLVQLADRLRENLRAIDLVARMGGEEFLVAMPRTSAAQARAAADRLRDLVHKTPFDLGPEGPQIHVTVSLGVAVSGQYGPDNRALGIMCDNADAALYSAKSAGRNQVVVSKSAA